MKARAGRTRSTYLLNRRRNLVLDMMGCPQNGGAVFSLPTCFCFSDLCEDFALETFTLMSIRCLSSSHLFLLIIPSNSKKITAWQLDMWVVHGHTSGMWPWGWRQLSSSGLAATSPKPPAAFAPGYLPNFPSPFLDFTSRTWVSSLYPSPSPTLHQAGPKEQQFLYEHAINPIFKLCHCDLVNYARGWVPEINWALIPSPGIGSLCILL